MQKLPQPPEDSILNHWMESMFNTEVPKSYQLAVGMSVIGSQLKRTLWVDQVKWRIYPPLSVMLVGPSGVGKDTAIRPAIQAIEKLGYPPVVAGRTIEFMLARLKDQPAPTCWVTPAPELAAFLGKADYQQDKMAVLTDLMSQGEAVDVSLKSEGKDTQLIRQPTPTVLAGTTENWLQNLLPQGALGGGFLPRFVIVWEKYNNKFVAWVKYGGVTREQLERAKYHEEQFFLKLRQYLSEYRQGECVPIGGAVELYQDWYVNRFERFDTVVEPYANRSRDQVHRMAMICGFSRGHSYMEACDMQFAIDFMQFVADRITNAVAPPTEERQCANEIMQLLPLDKKGVIRKLTGHWTRRQIEGGWWMLLEGEEIVNVNGKWERRS